MANEEAEKYILEQIKIEVEYTRSWPTKILGFYVAIDIGFVLAFVNKPGSLPQYFKGLLIALVVVAFVLGVRLLVVNHVNYLRYRSIQIKYQTERLREMREAWNLPVEWFTPITVSWRTRFGGYSFFLFLMFLVAVFTVIALWHI